MITRDEIRKIPELHKSIRRGMDHLEYLSEKATAISSSIGDGERVQSSADNKAGRYIDAAVDLSRDIEKERTELLELQRKALAFIETIDDPLHKKILRYRYIWCYSWEDVADLVGYQQRYIQRIEYEILQELE